MEFSFNYEHKIVQKDDLNQKRLYVHLIALL